jgi:ABC-2 type transport system permease protein
VLYVATQVPDRFRDYLMINPIAAVLTQMRHAVIDPAAPSAAGVIGSTAGLLIPAAIVVGVVLIGAWAFQHEAPRVAENL